MTQSTTPRIMFAATQMSARLSALLATLMAAAAPPPIELSPYLPPTTMVVVRVDDLAGLEKRVLELLRGSNPELADKIGGALPTNLLGSFIMSKSPPDFSRPMFIAMLPKEPGSEASMLPNLRVFIHAAPGQTPSAYPPFACAIAIPDSDWIVASTTTGLAPLAASAIDTGLAPADAVPTRSPLLSRLPTGDLAIALTALPATLRGPFDAALESLPPQLASLIQSSLTEHGLSMSASLDGMLLTVAIATSCCDVMPKAGFTDQAARDNLSLAMGQGWVASATVQGDVLQQGIELAGNPGAQEGHAAQEGQSAAPEAPDANAAALISPGLQAAALDSQTALIATTVLAACSSPWTVGVSAPDGIACITAATRPDDCETFVASATAAFASLPATIACDDGLAVWSMSFSDKFAQDAGNQVAPRAMPPFACAPPGWWEGSRAAACVDLLAASQLAARWGRQIGATPRLMLLPSGEPIPLTIRWRTLPASKDGSLGAEELGIACNAADLARLARDTKAVDPWEIQAASRAGDIDRLRRFIALAPGNFDLNAIGSGPYDQSPLMSAARGGHLPALQALIDAGCDAKGVNTNGYTALMAACESRKQEVALLLLDLGADVSAATKEGRTPLYYAARNCDSAMVKLLLDHGAITTQLVQDLPGLKADACKEVRTLLSPDN